MVYAVIGAIAEKLHAVFGEDCQIHMEKVTQGLQQPCFYIAVRQVSVQPLLGTRKKRQVGFAIQYYPKGGNAELYETGETLTRELEYITMKPDGGKLRGSGISYEIQGDILHFTIFYSMISTQTEDTDAMKTLHMATGTGQAEI